MQCLPLTPGICAPPQSIHLMVFMYMSLPEFLACLFSTLPTFFFFFFYRVKEVLCVSSLAASVTSAYPSVSSETLVVF